METIDKELQMDPNLQSPSEGNETKKDTSQPQQDSLPHTLPRIHILTLPFNEKHTIMCCHRLFIYSTCGHSHLSPHPLVTCINACIPPNSTYSTTCTLIAHPYQSWKVESLCPECAARRTQLLSQVEISQVVKFDEWKWKVSYGMPAHGKDFWGRKAEEREKEEEEKANLKRDGSTKRRKRFSLRRKSRRKEEERSEDREVAHDDRRERSDHTFGQRLSTSFECDSSRTIGRPYP